ncbi:MAG: restriction endonuclease [Clostridia bacterium]|nr:restriction endonuclease [Clostridia bacterium]
MNVFLNENLAVNYSSNSQKARVLTEGWVSENLYCPVCGFRKIEKFPNNQKVADFYCPNCHEQYELKSKKGVLGKKVADGAYDSFIQRIQASTNPDFLFMSYCLSDMSVHNLSFVPKFFFVPEIAEKRKPLGEKAKRHGWVGCNILYDQIPIQGRVSIIKDTKEVEQKIVQDNVKRAFNLKVENLDSRGWFFDVLHCVNGIKDNEFTLSQVYRFEEILEVKYKNNHNIRAKIRQQLQFLRNKGIIEFLGNGKYKKIADSEI